MKSRAAAENIEDMQTGFHEKHMDLLERLHRSEAYLPRFLFRGFNLSSTTAWGGLNSTQGIFPHAFRPDLNHANRPRTRSSVNSLDTDADIEPPPRLEDLDFWGLQSRALNHVQGYTSPLTPFTSWTADLSTAVYFARGKYRDEGDWNFYGHKTAAYLCILDTWSLLPAGERGRRIFHAPVVAGPDAEGLPMEYLVFGPVLRGPSFRCVRLSAIRRALSCDSWPSCDGQPTRTHHQVTAPEVRAALAAGCLFRQPGEADIDVVLVVAAGLLAAHQRDVQSPRPLQHWTMQMLTYLPPAALLWSEGSIEAVLECLGVRCEGEGSSSSRSRSRLTPLLSGQPLVNPSMDVRSAPQLQLARDLLCALDASLGGGRGKAVAGGTCDGQPLSGDVWERALHMQVASDEGAGHTCRDT